MLVNQTVLYKNKFRRYKHLVVNGNGTFFTDEETSAGKKYDGTLICQMIDFLIDNICIKIGNHLFWQCIGTQRIHTVPHFWLSCFRTHIRLNF